MKWLITGGCGFIGTNLIARLSTETGHDIRIVDNLSTGTREDLAKICQFVETTGKEVIGGPLGVELIEANILDKEVAVSASREIDVIVHLAANTGVGPSVADPVSDCYANVIGILNYLEAARANKVDRFVFASSGAPVGEVDPPIHEELPPHPISPYGASKLAGEGYCSAYYHSFNVDTVALRFGNVYGPGSIRKESVIAKFIRRALAGDELEIYGDGNQTRDFIYIEDLIDALLLAATRRGVGGEIFQIASSRETTINELVLELLEVIEKHGFAKPRVENSATRVGDVIRNYSDTSKARTQLGWQPRTNLKTGLKNTLDYFIG